MHTNVRSIVVPGTESVSSTPPVPPRRKKRKAKLAAIAKSPKGTSPTRLRKPDKKRLAPPPPPPPPRAVRRIKSHVAKDQAEETTSNLQTAGDAEETLNSLSSNEAGETSRPSSLQLEDADSVRIEKASKDENEKDDRCGSSSETKSSHKRPFVFETFARKETNKYPPLFFTLQDFQNVMSNTLQHEDDFNDEPSANFDSSFRDSFRDSLSDSFRNSFREFFEKSLDDEEDDLCFRVTTTNLPFEKCLDTWTATFTDRLIENFDVPGRFIFEDYVDRSNKVNVRRSAGPMCYDGFEEEPTVPRLTKVRFVIESPSSSISDHELNNDGETTCDSLQNIDPLTDEQEVNWNRGSSVKLTEITDDMDCTDTNTAFGQVQDFQEDHDEFGDVPFSSILKTEDSLDRWYSLDDATNFIREVDKGSFGQDDRGNSNDSIDASIGHDSQGESLCSEGKLKVADVSEAESSLIKLKAECCSVLAEVRDDCSERPPEDNGFARASNNCTASNNATDNKEYHVKKDLTSGACENENNNVKREEIISVGTNAIGDNIDWKLELIRNKVNVNFVEKDSIICRDKYLRTEINEEQSTINETKVFDQQVIKNKVENNVLEEHLLSNRTETDFSEEVSSAEGDMEIDKQRLKTNSVDKSTGEYRRKIFVKESFRNININRCDFTSNDFADDSEDSDLQDDHLDTGDISLSESERNFKGSITKGDAKQETKDIPVSQSNKKPQDSFIGNESLEKRKSITNPVNIQRNSFLVNMLSEDSDQIWKSCEIIAVHPKSLAKSEVSISKDEEGKKLANRLNESIKMDSEIQKILQESKAPLKRIETTLPRPTTAKKIAGTSKKTTGEAKCDVLNELLSNFSNIKLKPVNDKKRSAAESHPLVKTSSRQENDKERIEFMSDSRTQSLKDCNSDPSVETKETSAKSINVKAGASSVKQWQYAASLTTRKVQDDRNKSNESQKGPEGSQNAIASSKESVKRPESSEILSDRNEESRETDVNIVERTIKRWQSAASLTTSNYIQDERNKGNESQERSEDFQDDVSFVTSTVNRINRVERTTNEDYSELSRNTNEVLVEPTKSDAVRRVSDDEAGRGGASSVECLQMLGCSEKTDAKDESHNRGAYARQLELSKSMSSGDKSAIARRISRPHCNNNDNNRAVTPVAVSDDQSRDTVTITPGRVRSFVKYYEIRREATTDNDSKTGDKVDKDPMPEHQSVISICRGLEARAIETKFFEAQKKDNSKSFDAMKKDDHRGQIADQDFERSIGSARQEGQCAAIVEKFGTENSSRLDARIANTEDDYVQMKKQIHASPKSISDSCVHSGTAKRKKSVKFQGGFTVIGARNPDENGTAGSPAGQDTKLLNKKKNPDRPTLKGSVLAKKVDFGVGQVGESLDADSRSLEKRENAAQIQAAAKCEECSGINRFVPKPETPRLVFYCTV